MNPVTDVLVMLSWKRRLVVGSVAEKMIHQKRDNEIEKQEFLNYLDQHGVLNKITDVLLMLYNEPEQPSDVIDYVRKNMCADNPDVREIAKMTVLIENAKLRLAELQGVRDELKAKLEEFETFEWESREENGENDEDGPLEYDDDDYVKESDHAEHLGTA